jgi:hypothetical protein
MGRWLAVLRIAIPLAGAVLPGRSHAQGVYGQVGIGAGYTSRFAEAEYRPAAALAIGLELAGPLTLRLDVRVIGNTDTALLAAGTSAGTSAALGVSTFGYLLGAVGWGLFTEGQVAPHLGVVTGAGRTGGLPLFAEVRYDYFTASFTSVPRGRHSFSIVTGVRLGAHAVR